MKLQNEGMTNDKQHRQTNSDVNNGSNTRETNVRTCIPAQDNTANRLQTACTKMEPGSKEQNQRRDETEVFTLHSQNTRDKDIQQKYKIYTDKNFLTLVPSELKILATLSLNSWKISVHFQIKQIIHHSHCLKITTFEKAKNVTLFPSPQEFRSQLVFV